MAMTAIGYLIAWGPFASLCIWEMVTEPKVRSENFVNFVKCRFQNTNMKLFTFQITFLFYVQDIPELYRVIVCLFAKSATAYNPFIYFFMFKGFRRDTVNVLKRFL